MAWPGYSWLYTVVLVCILTYGKSQNTARENEPVTPVFTRAQTDSDVSPDAKEGQISKGITTVSGTVESIPTTAVVTQHALEATSATTDRAAGENKKLAKEAFTTSKTTATPATISSTETTPAANESTMRRTETTESKVIISTTRMSTFGTKATTLSTTGTSATVTTIPATTELTAGTSKAKQPIAGTKAVLTKSTAGTLAMTASTSKLTATFETAPETPYTTVSSDINSTTIGLTAVTPVTTIGTPGKPSVTASTTTATTKSEPATIELTQGTLKTAESTSATSERASSVTGLPEITKSAIIQMKTTESTVDKTGTTKATAATTFVTTKQSVPPVNGMSTRATGKLESSTSAGVTVRKELDQANSQLGSPFDGVNIAARELLGEAIALVAKFMSESVRLDPAVEDLLQNPIIQRITGLTWGKNGIPKLSATSASPKPSLSATDDGLPMNGPSGGTSFEVSSGVVTAIDKHEEAGELLYTFINFLKDRPAILDFILPDSIAQFFSFELNRVYSLSKNDFRRNVTFDVDAVARHFFDSIDITRLPVNLIPGIMDGLRPGNISESCYKDITNVLESAASFRPWALRMLDSWAKVPPGLLQGQTHLPGSLDECMEVVGESYTWTRAGESLIENSESFKGHYCRLTIGVPANLVKALWLRSDSDNTSGLTINYGSCFPDSCSTGDVRTMVTGLQIGVTAVACEMDSPARDGSFGTDTFAITVLCVLVMLFGVVGLCTVVDGLTYQPSEELNLEDDGLSTRLESSSRSKSRATLNLSKLGIELKETRPKPKPVLDPSLFGIAIAPKPDQDDEEEDGKSRSNDGEMENENETSKPVDAVVDKDIAKGLPKQILESFSLYTTLPALMKTEVRPGIIKGMDCIRFLSMCWIILGHTYSLYGREFLTSATNLNGADEALHYFTFQIVLSASLAADVFFLVSGTLAAFLLLNKLKSSGFSARTLPMYVLHRYWRLTPMLLVVSLLAGAVDRYAKSGPMVVGEWSDNESALGTCRTNWWRNILYINNFYTHQEKQCISWVWYLACDMQFYILAPLVVLPLFYKTTMGIVGCILLMATHIVSNGYYFGTASLGRNSLEREPSLHAVTYFKPYARIGPYAVGLLLGYILHRKHAMNSTVLKVVCWLLSLSMIYILTHVQYMEMRPGGQPWPSAGRAAFEALYRILYAVSLAWVIYALNNDLAGLMGPVFNWGGWRPLGRLTYSAYLLHPFLATIHQYNLPVVYYINHFTMAMIFIALLLISYALGAIMYVIVEAPFLGLEKVGYEAERKTIATLTGRASEEEQTHKDE